MKDTAGFDWIRVDNAGKIYPASMRKGWTALFRVSVTLTEDIDPAVLEEAQRRTFRRFPTMAVKLKSGVFWYYLQHVDTCPKLQTDVQNPCVRMNLKENDGFMVRVRYFGRTIAVEIFHVLADGTAGMSFLLTLAAEYISLKYGESIPRDRTILDCDESAKDNEIEDAFLRYARNQYMTRKEPNAYHIEGTLEPADIIHTITGQMSVSQVKEKARELNVTLTEYLAAVLTRACANIQARECRGRLLPVKVGVPVSLRQFYPDTNTKRNFASYVNIGIEPRLGDYSIAEIAQAAHSQMKLENNEKMMNCKFSTNVKSEKNFMLRPVPLFIKNIAMRAIFDSVGDIKTSTSLSNLGLIRLPAQMEKYVERVDFLVGPLSYNRVVAGAVSYRDTIYINFVRTIRESKVEREFFTLLVKEGIHVLIESNNDYSDTKI